jgi:rfaE bifunctional protein nucleotidyltransferase chain/domain
MTNTFADSWHALVDQSKKARSGGKTIVTTNGCFDILHRGHVRYLQYAKSLGDFLFVGINSDASVRQIKGPKRPINSEDARAEVLRALSCVDGVCVFNEATPETWLQAIQPHIHVKGADWNIETLPETRLLKTWGAKVVAAPFVEGYSTTKIIEKSQALK